MKQEGSLLKLCYSVQHQHLVSLVICKILLLISSLALHWRRNLSFPSQIMQRCLLVSDNAVVPLLAWTNPQQQESLNNFPQNITAGAIFLGNGSQPESDLFVRSQNLFPRNICKNILEKYLLNISPHPCAGVMKPR